MELEACKWFWDEGDCVEIGSSNDSQDECGTCSHSSVWNVGVVEGCGNEARKKEKGAVRF
jgi:hypothetical protein